MSAAIVALALFAVGILIGHFGIKKPDTEPGSDYLYVGCDNNQFSNAGKKYQDRLVSFFKNTP